MGLAVPEEAVIDHSHVVGCSVPFAHQNGAGSGEWSGGRLGRVGRAVTQHTRQQTVEFLGDRLREPSVTPLLPRIGNPECENVAPERCRWLSSYRSASSAYCSL